MLCHPLPEDSTVTRTTRCHPGLFFSGRCPGVMGAGSPWPLAAASCCDRVLPVCSRLVLVTDFNNTDQLGQVSKADVLIHADKGKVTEAFMVELETRWPELPSQTSPLVPSWVRSGSVPGWRLSGSGPGCRCRPLACCCPAASEWVWTLNLA